MSCCNAFIRGWLQRFGTCETLTSDNATTFTSDLWRDLSRILGIQVNYVPRYHQSTNGAVERQHRTIKESLKASLLEMGDLHRENWMAQLPFTLLGRRVAFQPDLGASPADYTLGASPLIPGFVFPDNHNPEDNQALLRLLQANSLHVFRDSSYAPPANDSEINSFSR